SPVTEPPLPAIEGKLLRAFPDELPSDELNTKIDEAFVPVATNTIPRNQHDFQTWRKEKCAELQRVCLRAIFYNGPLSQIAEGSIYSAYDPQMDPPHPGPQSGFVNFGSMRFEWNSFPATKASMTERWLVFIGGN